MSEVWAGPRGVIGHAAARNRSSARERSWEGRWNLRSRVRWVGGSGRGVCPGGWVTCQWVGAWQIKPGPAGLQGLRRHLRRASREAVSGRAKGHREHHAPHGRCALPVTRMWHLPGPSAPQQYTNSVAMFPSRLCMHHLIVSATGATSFHAPDSVQCPKAGQTGDDAIELACTEDTDSLGTATEARFR
jgi:hypothetical protein